MQHATDIANHHASGSFGTTFQRPRIRLFVATLLLVLCLSPSGQGEAQAPTQDSAERTSALGTQQKEVTHGPGAAPKIDLNRASALQLQRLPGIGPRKAERIVALRERIGGFRHVAHLLRVKGIGRRTLARLRPHVQLSPARSQPR